MYINLKKVFKYNNLFFLNPSIFFYLIIIKKLKIYKTSNIIIIILKWFLKMAIVLFVIVKVDVQ